MWFIITYFVIVTLVIEIAVMLIKRGTEILRTGRLQTAIESGDILYVYGLKDEIRRIFAEEIKEKEALLLKDEKKALSMMGGG